jgi:Family of unknown function (DUF6338)
MEKLFNNQEALAIFLLFFVPGFISLKVYDLLVPGERRDFSKSLYEAMAYSALNLGVLFWLFDFVLSAQLPRFWWYLSWFVALVAFPAGWPILGLWIRGHPKLAGKLHNPNPRVWDSLFQRGEHYWVIVHLNDGHRIGGVYSSRSFVSSSPAPPEIFLEEVWKLDDKGAFHSKIERTAGILISGKDILLLEFFTYS